MDAETRAAKLASYRGDPRQPRPQATQAAPTPSALALMTPSSLFRIRHNSSSARKQPHQRKRDERGRFTRG
jgi:hypothetical protein